jgi:hypothetical protein
MNTTSSGSVRDMLGETTTLLCFLAFYGPPIVFLAAPWLLLALMLMGPFTLVLMLVVALLAAAALIAGLVALVAAPVAIIRSRRAARTADLSVTPSHRAVLSGQAG